jgi:hypothetical protein
VSRLHVIARVGLAVGLAVWFAALASAGVAAMGVFTTLPELAPHVPEYAAFPASEHGRLAAGIVMERIFAAIDATQAVCAVVAVIAAFLLSIRARRRSIALARLGLVAVATVLLGVHLVFLAPRMQVELVDFRDAARGGDLEKAALHRGGFEQLHPTADRILRVNLFLVLGAIALTAWPDPEKRPPA